MTRTLFVGPSIPDVSKCTVREITKRADTEHVKIGEIIKRWDYATLVNEDLLRPSDLAKLRTQGDPLADAVVDLLDLKPGEDAFIRLEAQLAEEQVEPCITNFWNAVNTEPPESITGFTQVGKDGKRLVVATPEDVMKKNDRFPATPSLADGQAFFWRYTGQIFNALMHFSLAGGFSSPRLAGVLNETGYLTSAHNEATYKRLLETTLFVLDAMSDMRVGEGRGWKSAIRVRLLHAQVRKKIREGRGRLKTYTEAEFGVPINQADLAAVLGSFMIAPLWSMRRGNVSLSTQEAASYQAAWRHVGYYLGVDVGLLERFYGGTFATAETSFASLAFDTFADEVPSDGLTTPTYRILAAVANRPPRASKVGYHCEYARLLLGNKLADHLAIPRGSAAEWRSVRVDAGVSWLMLTFGRHWRLDWERERQRLFAQVIETLVVWQLGQRRTVFAWREESKRAEALDETEGEEPGVKFGPAVGKDIRSRWKWLLAEMVGVVAVTGFVGAVGAVWLVRSAHRS